MSSYDLESLRLPVLEGRGLSMFAAALENRLLRPLILRRLLRDAGLARFERLVCQESPTFEPLAVDGGDTRTPTTLEQIVESVPQPEATEAGGSVRDYARAYRQGRTDPEAVAERFLEAQRESDAGPFPLRAFIAVDEEDIRRQAAASARRFKEGRPLSVFDGVPVAVKDEVDQIPYPTTVGTSFLGRRGTERDATVVARLREVGALLVGKTNMHEIGINPNGHNLHHGMARNPFHPGHDTGGSSSGSAVAVATGLCPVAVGADGGGSIRIPAALCGAVGLKPTFGRLSEHGAAALCWSVAHLGPIGATVQDVALCYQVMAGSDPADPNTHGQPAVSLSGFCNTDLGDLTLGVFRPWFAHATGEVVTACEGAVEELARCGARVREIEVPGLDAMRMAHAVIILSEMAAAMEAHVGLQRELAPAVRINLTVGRTFSSRDYVKAQQIRTRALNVFRQVFEQVNAVVTPATAMTAPAIREAAATVGFSDLGATTEVMRYAFPANLAGLPAMSFPVGYDAEGLPIALQVMSSHWQEETLFRLASAWEQSLERRLPQRHYRLF